LALARRSQDRLRVAEPRAISRRRKSCWGARSRRPAIKPASVVADRIRDGLKYVPAERPVVAPDCGMKYMPRHIAFGKLKAMCDAAAAVRKEIG
jgi:methionine synthase II (cobalamin-independent)